MLCKLICGTLGAVFALFIAPSLFIASAGFTSRASEPVVTESAGRHARYDEHGREDEREFKEKEEVRREFNLAPGARVEVWGIRGTVDIETSDTNKAEVYIVRSARSRADLSFRRINIEQSEMRLAVRREWVEDERNVEVRHRVLLKLPRRIELTVESVNGRVRVGEVDGAVKLGQINGGVTVARATSHTEITSINGGVTMTIARLGAQGVRVKSVNGGVNLRFTEELNADVDVTHFNGGVHADLPNVVVLSEPDKSNKGRYRARIGAGGTPIVISHINGGVSLSRAA